MGIYVEITIQGEMDEVWRLTQTPDQHVRWDLRFTDIEYLPRPDPALPQQFLYATRIGFGMAIRGTGETVGQRDQENGSRTSALKFWSQDPRSLIREGAGYWKYVPEPGQVRFLTYYDYQVRFGWLGRCFDSVIFRPLMGWATAWSFDRLRLWIEKGLDPSLLLRLSLVHAVSRVMVALVWIYHGAVPKLIFQHPDEYEMLYRAGISVQQADWMVRYCGYAEVAFGLLMLLLFRARWPFVVTILLMVIALVGVSATAPHYLVGAFNPVSLNLQMIALSVIGLLTSANLPTASRCRRKRPENQA